MDTRVLTTLYAPQLNNHDYNACVHTEVRFLDIFVWAPRITQSGNVKGWCASLLRLAVTAITSLTLVAKPPRATNPRRWPNEWLYECNYQRQADGADVYACASHFQAVVVHAQSEYGSVTTALLCRRAQLCKGAVVGESGGGGAIVFTHSEKSLLWRSHLQYITTRGG